MSSMSNLFAVVNALAVRMDGATVCFPAESLANTDPGAYVELCRACVQNQTAYVQSFASFADAVVAAVQKVGDVTLADLGSGVAGVAGYAETVLSAGGAGVKSLYVAGKPYAEVAAECVVDPVGCVERGKWYKKNRARKARGKAKAESASGSSSQGDSGDELKRKLRESFDRKRILENELQVCKVGAELDVARDARVVAARADAEVKRAQTASAVAAVKASRALSDLESVAPGSSASQHEVDDFRVQLYEKDELCFELETALRAVDPDRARAIMQKSVRTGLGFGIGVAATRNALVKDDHECDEFCGVDCWSR